MKKAAPFIFFTIALVAIIYLMNSITTMEEQGIKLVCAKHFITAAVFIISFMFGVIQIMKRI
jgi:hypothetical protein